jgi:hypothetical protein
MTVIRQAGYAPIAVHVRDNADSTTTQVPSGKRPPKKSLIAFILAFRKKFDR